MCDMYCPDITEAKQTHFLSHHTVHKIGGQFMCDMYCPDITVLVDWA